MRKRGDKVRDQRLKTEGATAREAIEFPVSRKFDCPWGSCCRSDWILGEHTPVVEQQPKLQGSGSVTETSEKGHEASDGNATSNGNVALANTESRKTHT